MKSFFKGILVVIILGAIGFGGYIGYRDYIGPKFFNKEVNQNIEENKNNEEQVNNNQNIQNEENTEEVRKANDEIEALKKENERLQAMVKDTFLVGTVDTLINYNTAKELAMKYSIDFSDEILGNYVKNVFENSAPQTESTVANNPKSIVAMVGYINYGKTLALDYVIDQIVEKTAKYNEADKQNEALVKQLEAKYKNDEDLKKISNKDEKINYLLDKNAKEQVREVLKMETSNLGSDIYSKLLKEYNPVYYNSLLKNDPLPVSMELPSVDVNEYLKQVGMDKKEDTETQDTKDENTETKSNEEVKTEQTENVDEKK